MNAIEIETQFKKIRVQEVDLIKRCYGDLAQEKIAEKLSEEYEMSECNEDFVEMKKGFSYFEITRGGRCYRV